MKRVPTVICDPATYRATYVATPLSFQRTLLLLAVTVFAACAESDSGPTAFGDPHEVAPPAGDGSSMPHLVNDAGAGLLSWLEPVDATEAEGAWRVSTSRFEAEAWSPRNDVVEREGMFINWADFPSVISSSGTLFAHWLQRGPEGGYDYSVNVKTSAQDNSWSEGFVLHEDSAPVEHGFVSTVPLPGGRIGAVWLDGRDFSGEDPHEMQVRYRELGREGPTSEETLLDVRACDCCQTDLALAGDGLVAVYRDRSPDEIRDISIVRQSDGEWSDPIRVHDDGWEIAGCPVNGPAIAAREAQVVVAWFTGAQDTARVKLAFSQDGGRTFDPPVRIDSGAPLGRVDVVLLPSQGPDRAAEAVVSWIEATQAGGTAEVRVRSVLGDELGDIKTVATTTSARSSGFPQMIRLGSDLLIAWTDTEAQRVRAVTLAIGGER